MGGVAAVVVISATSVFLLNKSTSAETTEPTVQVASSDPSNAASTTPRTDSTSPAGAEHAPKADIVPTAAALRTKSELNAGVANVVTPNTPPVSARRDSAAASDSPRPEAKGPSAGAGNATAASTAVQTNATPQPVPPAPAAVAPASPSAAATSETAPARDIPAELRDLVARYAQAISAHDLSAIRAVYPRITSEQQRGFEQFFASTKGLQATLSLGSIDVRDAAANGRVSGTYMFTSSSGRNERQAMNFRATFERQGDKWVLSSVQ